MRKEETGASLGIGAGLWTGGGGIQACSRGCLVSCTGILARLRVTPHQAHVLAILSWGSNNCQPRIAAPADPSDPLALLPSAPSRRHLPCVPLGPDVLHGSLQQKRSRLGGERLWLIARPPTPKHSRPHIHHPEPSWHRCKSDPVDKKGLPPTSVSGPL